MTPNQSLRQEFRRAVADEVATLRAINTALRGPLTGEDANHLYEVRRVSMANLRRNFTLLYPGLGKKPVRSVRAISRIEGK